MDDSKADQTIKASTTGIKDHNVYIMLHKAKETMQSD